MTDNLQLTHGRGLPLDWRWLGAPATGGNMSMRQDEHLCWLSESEKDKGSLTTADFLRLKSPPTRAPSGRKPSAETGLHTSSIACSPKLTLSQRSHRQCHGAVAAGERGRAEDHRFRDAKSLTGQIRIGIRCPSRCLITTGTSTPSPRASPITRAGTPLNYGFFCAAMA